MTNIMLWLYRGFNSTTMDQAGKWLLIVAVLYFGARIAGALWIH